MGLFPVESHRMFTVNAKRMSAPLVWGGWTVPVLLLLTSFGMHLGRHCHCQTCYIFFIVVPQCLAQCCWLPVEIVALSRATVRILWWDVFSLCCLISALYPLVMPTTTTTTSIGTSLMCSEMATCGPCSYVQNVLADEILLPPIYHKCGFGLNDSSADAQRRSDDAMCVFLVRSVVWFLALQQIFA